MHASLAPEQTPSVLSICEGLSLLVPQDEQVSWHNVIPVLPRCSACVWQLAADTIVVPSYSFL